MTIRVRITGTQLKPISGSATQARLHAELVHLWFGAGEAFVRAVALEGVVKVDTGMSRGSLLPLSRAVGLLAKVRASITADRALSRGGETAQSRVGRRKTIAAGIRAGENAFEFEVGSPSAPLFIFAFEIKVLQYLIREEGQDLLPAWNSMIKGREAFLEHINLYAGPRLQAALTGIFDG